MQMVIPRNVPDALRKVAERLQGSRLVMYDAERSVWLAWKGGHGVHVYNIEGREVSHGSVGDYEAKDAPRTAVRQWMADRIRRGDYPS